MDRVIYIADCGVEQTILPLASQFQQDEYAWAMKSICTIDQGMPWSNAMAYGVAHDLVPWVETDLRLLTHHSGVTLSDLELWVQYGDCFIQALDVADLFDNPTQMDSDSRVQATPTMAHNINDDLDDFKCNEAIEDKPLCIRKLNLM